MAHKNQWVSPSKKGWSVKGEGNIKATRIFHTQEKAIQAAVKIAKNQKSEVIVQGRNGKIRSKDSYGNDSCPPRDKEN